MLLVEQKYELRLYKSALERTQTYSLKEILARFYPRKKLNGSQYGQTFFFKSLSIYRTKLVSLKLVLSCQ